MSEITKKADGPLTEERVHVLRKQMKGRRYCMDEETEIIFLANPEDVKKYQYRLIQDYSMEEWIADQKMIMKNGHLQNFMRTSLH